MKSKTILLVTQINHHFDVSMAGGITVCSEFKTWKEAQCLACLLLQPTVSVEENKDNISPYTKHAFAFAEEHYMTREKLLGGRDIVYIDSLDMIARLAFDSAWERFKKDLDSFKVWNAYYQEMRAFLRALVLSKDLFIIVRCSSSLQNDLHELNLQGKQLQNDVLDFFEIIVSTFYQDMEDEVKACLIRNNPYKLITKLNFQTKGCPSPSFLLNAMYTKFACDKGGENE